MGITARNLRAHPFGGTATSSTPITVGANGSPFISGTATDRFIPGMDAVELVVAWEIKNTDATTDLLIRFGPAGESMTAAAGQTLDNFVRLAPNSSYNYPILPSGQQLNDNIAGTVASVLLLQGDGGTATFTGMCTSFRPTDDS